MSVINATPLLAAAGGDYQISRSVRLRSSASAYFNRTPASAGNRKTWTWSGWVKRGTLGAVNRIFSADDGTASTDQDYNSFLFNSSDQLVFGGNLTTFRVTTAVYRDPSAWYHIVFVTDTTQATAANRFKLYVNGSEVTAFGTSNNPSQNTDLAVNATIGHFVGSIASGSYFDGYLTEVNFIDGQALTPSSFGETDSITGVWKPKKYAGTYGTNGFYLNFSDNSAATAAAIGKDYSGNGNNWTPNNISVTAGVTYDSMLDVPTLYADGGNGRGNYCVLNPLDRNSSASVADGNLSVSTSAVNVGARATIGVNSGKWYWEVTVSAIGSTNVDIGVADSAWDRTYVGSASSSWGYFSSGQKYNNGSASSYGASYTTGDTIGVAFDADAATLTFYKNGSSQGQAFTGVSGSNPVFPAVSGQTSSALACNFGQRPFAYTPPTGFKALNTQNLPEPTIKKGNQWFDATTYTGNGGTLAVTNTGGFQPDFVWVKNRGSATSHVLQDAVRGAGKSLFSNATAAESGNAGDLIASFNSSGFTVNDTYLGGSGGGGTNGASNSYVGWQWKESASAGFDIVTYTGNASGAARSVAHSLGVAPKLMITKGREAQVTGTDHWVVWHGSFVAGDYILLSATNAKANASSYWGNTVPNSSNFYVGGSASNVHNESGKNYVAYLFAEVAGFSKFGSYTGNGSSTDGPFQYLGFAPAFIMLKRTDSTGNWAMYDRARSPKNADTKVLYPNLSNTEDASTDHFDWLSNGFKMKSTNQNTSGGTFIYAAFAESPFKTSLAR